jgi:hypothetical protein
MSDSSVNITPTGSTPVGTDDRTTGAGVVNLQQVVNYKGTPNKSGPITSSPIATGSTVAMPSTIPVTSGKKGWLEHALFSSTQPTLWTVVTVDNAGGLTSVAPFLTSANETFDFKPGMDNEVATVASTGAAKFQVAAQNISSSGVVAATAYAAFFWAENLSTEV